MFSVATAPPFSRMLAMHGMTRTLDEPLTDDPQAAVPVQIYRESPHGPDRRRQVALHYMIAAANLDQLRTARQTAELFLSRG